MAETFKQTPASRVFGFGLRPQRTQSYQPTLMGIPLLEERENLSPFLRQNAFQEQAMAAQEDALAAQQQEMQARQQELMRHQQVLEAEDAAMQDLAAGEQLGNIFKKNPALAFSRNAGQLASAAQMIQPSRATMTLAPQLAAKMPLRQRQHFNKLLATPDFQNDVLAAKDKAEELMAIEDQQAELLKNDVPLDAVPAAAQRILTPAEIQTAIIKHKKGSANPRLDYLKDYMDNLGKRVAAFEERGDAFDEKGQPTKTLLDLRNKYAQVSDLYDQESMGFIMPKVAPANAATAQNITAPGAMGGAPAPVVPTPTAIAPNLEAELSRVPVMDQAAWLEKRKEQEAEQGKINEAWTKAKNDLEERLKKKFPDKPYPGLKTSPLEQLAMQIVNNVSVIDTSVPTAGDAPLNIPIADKVLLDLGEDIFSGKAAFTEPGSKRKRFLGLLGSQEVTQGELIRDWAQRFLQGKGLIPTSIPEAAGVPKEEAEPAVNFLNSKVAVPK